MSKVTEIKHPLILHKLAYIRSKDTGSKYFRELVEEVSMLMAYEVTRDLETEEVEVETPICKTKCQMLAGKKIAIVPILRAGLGMVDGILNLIPDIAERDIIVVDPMLATGGSAADAISLLKKRGAKKIRLMCLISSPEGVKLVQEKHPDVDIYLASIDEKLNEKGYIVPGLGDAGDRLFGTK